MSYKWLFAVQHFPADLIEKKVMLVTGNAGKIFRIQMPKGTILKRDNISQSGLDADLYPFNGVHDKKAELPVKDIPIPHDVEGRVCLQNLCFLLAERVPVSAETVIIDII